jgi:dienelactone hydrolase
LSPRDSLAGRWAKLSPFVHAYGPADDKPRPAVLLFHGCGGVRGHMPHYAHVAVEAGWRVFVVDSFTPRGWTRLFAQTFVCTGAKLQGYERAGDVAAAIHGISARRDVDDQRIALAGWSHGAWAIMELMAAPLSERHEIGLSGADRTDRSGVKAVFLAYAYIGPGTPRRSAPWVHKPSVFGMIARQDHLTSVGNAEKVYDAVRHSGVHVQTWVANGTHGFDEPKTLPPMRYAPAIAAEAHRHFRTFLEAAFEPAMAE